MSEERRPILEMEDTQWSEGWSRRKKACVAMVAILLGVGVCLAVALPLALKGDSRRRLQSQDFGYPKPLLLFAKVPIWSEESSTTGNTETGDSNAVYVTRSNDDDEPHHYTHRTRRSRPTDPPTEPATRRPRPTLWTIAEHTTTRPYPWSECPEIESTERSLLDLKGFEGKTLYEVTRVQSANSPGYREGAACVRVKTPGGKGGVVNVTWEEGRRRHRSVHYATFELESTHTENDWIEKMIEPYNDTARYSSYLSVLGQWGNQLLIYHCYPHVLSHINPPGYVISVLTTDLEGISYKVTESLLEMAQNLHLNPGRYRPEYIRHDRCYYDNDGEEEE